MFGFVALPGFGCGSRFFGLQGLVTALWTMYRSSTSSPFGASQSVDGRVYAIISQFTVSVQHAIERVERPGESQ